MLVINCNDDQAASRMAVTSTQEVAPLTPTLTRPPIGAGGALVPASIHQRVLQPGEQVTVQVVVDARAAAGDGACRDFIDIMVPAVVVNEVANKSLSCTFGQAESSTMRSLETPDHRLVLSSVEILVLVAPDFPERGLGKRSCLELRDSLVRADLSSGTAARKTLCSVEVQPATRATAGIGIRAAVAADAPIGALSEDVPCWQLARYMRGNSGGATVPVPCLLF
ncbi:MAG: hypothetical protein HYX51_05790 [Chloroflexi bacterium]|nr:hypothetical protein [Chloroflexota bacterium]